MSSLVIDPTNANQIYVGTGGSGVFKTVDAAANWAPSSTGLTDHIVLSVLVDPVATSTVYAATFYSGVHKSTDSGLTWVPVNNGIQSSQVAAMAMSPTNHDDLQP